MPYVTPQSYRAWNKRKPTMPTTPIPQSLGLPKIGHMLGLTIDPMAVMQRLHRQFPHIVEVAVPPHTFFVVTNPTLIEEVLVTKQKHFHKDGHKSFCIIIKYTKFLPWFRGDMCKFWFTFLVPYPRKCFLFSYHILESAYFPRIISSKVKFFRVMDSWYLPKKWSARDIAMKL